MSTLSKEEIIKYHTRGFAGPYDAFHRDQALQYRDSLENTFQDLPAFFTSIHVLSKTFCDVMTAAPVLDAVKQIVGQDVLLWKGILIRKQPKETLDEIRWHQDSYYRKISPGNDVGVWLALDDITPENGCIIALPGTHWYDIPHVKASGGLFPTEADVRQFDSNAPTEMLLCKAGQFFLFNEKIIHRSGVNQSDRKRFGLIGRFIGTNVHIEFPKAASILVSGEDKFKYNHLINPPTER